MRPPSTTFIWSILFALCAGCDPSTGISPPANADLAAPADGGTSGWPMPGHDPQRTSRADSRGPQQGRVLWTAAVTSHGPPVVAPDGTIYVASGSQAGIAALAPADGTVKWTAAIGCQNLALGPDGTIYSDPCTNVPRLCAFDPTTRMTRWCVVTPSDPVVPLAVTADGTVYAAFAAELAAIAPADGKARWTAKLPANVAGLALALDGSVIAVTPPAAVVALAPQDGRIRWSVPRGVLPYFPSVGADGSIYVVESADYMRVLALSPADGVERWRSSTAFVSPNAAPAIAPDGTLRWVLDLVEPRGMLHAISAGGKPAWSFTALKGEAGPPALDAVGTSYFVGGGGHVYAIDAAGAPRWDLDAGVSAKAAPPILGPKGRLYVMGTDDKLRAIGD